MVTNVRSATNAPDKVHRDFIQLPFRILTPRYRHLYLGARPGIVASSGETSKPVFSATRSTSGGFETALLFPRECQDVGERKRVLEGGDADGCGCVGLAPEDVVAASSALEQRGSERLVAEARFCDRLPGRSSAEPVARCVEALVCGIVRRHHARSRVDRERTVPVPNLRARTSSEALHPRLPEARTDVLSLEHELVATSLVDPLLGGKAAAGQQRDQPQRRPPHGLRLASRRVAARRSPSAGTARSPVPAPSARRT